ncbi:RNA-binding protein [Clostridium polyendosporum]|uniref:RNA-binding protein n=1 Tax=Clostridium polyendosporum TaxID=69208 RepID=A0A919VEJ4_9CLOT|nr:YhbY family RNA-binding protein [Clostridium polyendosporum]GIM29219.1 RNA-binding protein [Clostridium polyendosporum]
MITSKQRAYLRSLANGIESIFQLGKNGIEEPFLNQIESALEARELIKITVLENSGYGTREASDIICEKLGCEGIQAIGSKMVLYKKSLKKPKIELPVEKKK